jgi:Domain of unknown function (DUF1772)
MDALTIIKLWQSCAPDCWRVFFLGIVLVRNMLFRDALLTAIAWLLLIRSRWTSVEFWLMVLSACGVMLIVALTRAVNVPLNNRLMTWNIDTPPADLRQMWAPWDRENTIRAFVSTGVLIVEAIVLSTRASG